MGIVALAGDLNLELHPHRLALEPLLEVFEEIIGAAALCLGLGEIGLVDGGQPGVADVPLAVVGGDPLEGVERVVAARGEARVAAENAVGLRQLRDHARVTEREPGELHQRLHGRLRDLEDLQNPSWSGNG